MWLLLGLMGISDAKTVYGVTMPDTISLSNTILQLNGMGLREKYWIDIYVAGLYIPQKMTNPNSVIKMNSPKEIRLEFIYSSVPKEKMIEVLEEHITQNPQFSKQTVDNIRVCESWMQDFTTKDTAKFTYIPNQGTSVTINNTLKGTIQGTEFMEAIFSIYLGTVPASESLKQSLLGG